MRLGAARERFQSILHRLSVRYTVIRAFIVRWRLAFFTVGILLLLARLGYWFSWTGFGESVKPSERHQPAKTLWDWMQLLVIPVLLAGGAMWFESRREKLARELDERRRDEERALEHDRVREERLQKYLDDMTELMLDKGLRSSEPNSDERVIARARTLTVLRSLDGGRKGELLNFLYESGLVDINRKIVLLFGEIWPRQIFTAVLSTKST